MCLSQIQTPLYTPDYPSYLKIYYGFIWFWNKMYNGFIESH
jgi:hypothetical protein